MPNLKWTRAVLLAAAFITGHEVSTGSGPGSPRGLPAWGGGSDRVSLLTSVSPDPVDATSTYYSLRRDMRRCASPRCGGYFVKRVNFGSTRCGNGQWQSECYVAEIDWNGQPEIDEPQMVVRGSIVAKRFPRFGNLGALHVSESWRALGSNRPVGTFYLVRDRGVRCITFPCPTHQEAKLNANVSQNIAGVSLAGAGLGENNAPVVYAAMTGPDGVIVTGNDVPVRGPGGRSFELKATQVYVRTKTDSGSMKPCFKTGCSSQVCSDETVMTTCEFRPEYACYQKAACERQADGNCGFTKTAELTACLAKK